MTKAEADAHQVLVKFEELKALLGKIEDDPAVTALLERVGKVSWQKPSDGARYALAKDAGFDLLFDSPERRQPRVLTCLFLSERGKNGEVCELPHRFAFGARADLLKKLPKPAMTWLVGEGDVPVDTPDPSHDAWYLDGLKFIVTYDDEEIHSIQVAVDDRDPDEALTDNTFHLLAKPADAPKHAMHMPMALLTIWAVVRLGPAGRTQDSALTPALLQRGITPSRYLFEVCGGVLRASDVHADLMPFLRAYLRMGYVKDRDTAPKRRQAVAKLLCLDKESTHVNYSDDYVGTFANAVSSTYYVPDSWDAWDRLVPILDARRADFQATGFKSEPELAGYEAAATLRDQVKLSEAKAQVTAVALDADLAEQMIAFLGVPLKDKAIKALFARIALPVGKKIDEQANPAIGLSYMGSKITVDGKSQLAVTSVKFYAAGQRSYIRGLGTEVIFQAFVSALPAGLQWGTPRRPVSKNWAGPTTPMTICDGSRTKTHAYIVVFTKASW